MMHPVGATFRMHPRITVPEHSQAAAACKHLRERGGRGMKCRWGQTLRGFFQLPSAWPSPTMPTHSPMLVWSHVVEISSAPPPRKGRINGGGAVPQAATCNVAATASASVTTLIRIRPARSSQRAVGGSQRNPPAYLEVHTAFYHFLGNGKIRRFGCSLLFSSVAPEGQVAFRRP